MIAIPAKQVEVKRRIRNKITGKVKAHVSFGISESKYWIEIYNTGYMVFKKFPKLFFERI